jgi:P4 family phage/plasmid primase-like protien
MTTEKDYKKEAEELSQKIMRDGKKVKKKDPKISEATKELSKEAGIIFTKKGQAEKFTEIQPLFYDRNQLWWLWNNNRYCWEIVDDVDILNMIEESTKEDIITPKNRTLILNSLKQEGRKKIPEEAKKSWVQFGNEIYDVNSEEVFEATPKYFITNPIPYSLGKIEDTPEIDRLFVSWVGEENKEELYEILAFCLVPEYFIHRIICLIGSGANGKGTYLRILKKFIGECNITSSTLESLIKVRFEGAKLYKKLVCLMGETNFITINRTEFLKSATGEDTIRGEYKGVKGFDFVNVAKLIMATNTLPMTQDKTIGYYRRWKILDFNNVFKKEQDVLSRIPEQEYNNLSLKCLNIVKKLYQKRLFINDGTYEERKKKYEEKSNPIMLFIKENYEKDINGKVVLSEFYEELGDFLLDNEYRELTARAVSDQLKTEGFEIKKTTTGNITTTRILGLRRKIPVIPKIPDIIHTHTHEARNTLKGIKGISGILEQQNLDVNDTYDTSKEKEQEEKLRIEVKKI